MDRFLVAGLLVAGAAAMAFFLQRRAPEEPVRTAWAVPSWLDRAEFSHPEVSWLVVVFSSATCRSCQDTVAKARLLESGAVAVQDVEVAAQPDLHERYGIEAVPTVVIADAEGAVRASFIGPPTATDLWARLAELREPGSVPPGCEPG